jgi:hypothetical protein
VLEPKHWYHKLAVKRKDTYRRLALDGLGSSNLISEHAIVRAHDRAQPLLVKCLCRATTAREASTRQRPR